MKNSKITNKSQNNDHPTSKPIRNEFPLKLLFIFFFYLKPFIDTLGMELVVTG